MALVRSRGIVGVDLTSCSSVKEAGLKAGHNFTVCKTPLFRASGLPSPLVVELTREDTQEALGKASPGFGILQNEQANSLLEAVAGEGGTPLRGGILDGGATCWMSYKVGETFIAGDKITGSVTTMNSHDGGGSSKTFGGELRDGCLNQLISLLRASNILYSFRHTSGIQARVTAARAVIMAERTRLQELKRLAEELLKISVSEQRFAGLVSELLPYPEGLTDRKKANVDEKRAGLYQEIKAIDLANFNRTGWGFVQAVAALTTHEHRENENENGATRRFFGNLAGAPLLANARELVLALA